MDKLIERFQETTSNLRRVDPISAPMTVAVLDEKETGQVRYMQGGQVQYELFLRLSATYWANQAQHYSARQAAELMLKDHLYRDVVITLSRIRGMLYSVDRTAIDRALTELIGELRP